MAINTHLLGNVNTAVLEATEGYSDNNVMQILAENSYNYAQIVRATIENDVRELSLSEAGAVEAEIVAIQEAGVGGFFEGLKEFFVKIGQKIKGMLEKVIAKIRSFFMSKRDFVKKYKDKFINNDLKDMKVSWRKPFDWNITIDSVIKTDECVKRLNAKFSNKAEGTVNTSDFKNGWDDEKAREGIYKNVLSTACNKIAPDENFKKEVFDVLFDTQSKDTDVIGAGEKSKILAILMDDKLVSNMEKQKSDNEKTIKDIIKAIDKARDEQFKSANDSTGVNKATGLSNTSKYAHIIGNLYSLAAGTAISAQKFLVQQSYSVFVKGVNFSKKSEETLLDSIEEVAFNEANEELNEEYAY